VVISALVVEVRCGKLLMMVNELGLQVFVADIAQLILPQSLLFAASDHFFMLSGSYSAVL